MNFPVTRSDIALFKGVKNTIDLLIKDIDRKPVITTDTPILRIFQRGTRAVLLTVPLTLIDPVKARYQALFLAGDVADLPLGNCDYCVTLLAADGSEAPLFTDRDRQDMGAVEIRQSGTRTPGTVVTILPETFIIRGDLQGLPMKYTSAYPGAAQVGNLSGVSTYVVFGNRFTGTITLQGSLDDMPTADDNQWADVESHDFADIKGNQGFTFIGNYAWIRFKIKDLTDYAALEAGQDIGGSHGGCGTGNGCPPCSCCNCLSNVCGCGDDDDSDQGALITPIDWPPGTPFGIVKIQYRA